LKQAIEAAMKSKEALKIYAHPVQFPQSLPGSIVLP